MTALMLMDNYSRAFILNPLVFGGHYDHLSCMATSVCVNKVEEKTSFFAAIVR